MARSLASTLGRVARLSLQDAAELQAKRNMSDAPKLFGREAPVDRSASFLPKSPYIEAWVWRRDHMEREFTWNFRNTVESLWFLGGFTFLCFQLSVFSLRKTDERNNYPKRDMLMAGSDTKFTLPDEREFY